MPPAAQAHQPPAACVPEPFQGRTTPREDSRDLDPKWLQVTLAADAATCQLEPGCFLQVAFADVSCTSTAFGQTPWSCTQICDASSSERAFRLIPHVGVRTHIGGQRPTCRQCFTRHTHTRAHNFSSNTCLNTFSSRTCLNNASSRNVSTIQLEA
eukprot:6475774-Amphidinium_carterae.1